MPPPEPGPNPGPDPGPIPPPRPLPTPPPDPKPFEASPDFDNGSPKSGEFIFGMLVSGGIISVGSITNLGFSTWVIMGGTNCLLASFGRFPLLTGVGDRSPPPPPPCMASFFTVGLYGAISGAISSIC